MIKKIILAILHENVLSDSRILQFALSLFPKPKGLFIKH